MMDTSYVGHWLWLWLLLGYPMMSVIPSPRVSPSTGRVSYSDLPCSGIICLSDLMRGMSENDLI